jgi:hypothetical protein
MMRILVDLRNIELNGYAICLMMIGDCLVKLRIEEHINFEHEQHIQENL